MCRSALITPRAPRVKPPSGRGSGGARLATTIAELCGSVRVTYARIDVPGRRLSTLSTKGLSLTLNTFYGLGLGDACAAGEAGGGDGEGGGIGDGEGSGLAEGDAEGLAEGDAEGLAEGDAEAVGDGVALQPPARKMYCVLAPLQPLVIPDGWEYQSRMLPGRALMKRLMVDLPTCSPYAVMRPPPPFGAVLPTQTPTTILGL